MSQVRFINAGEIVNIITDFSTRQGRIHYRIRLHLHGGENLLFADYIRFEQYRKAWLNLQQAKYAEADLRIRH